MLKTTTSILLSLTLFLAACSGGGGGNAEGDTRGTNFPPPPTDMATINLGTEPHSLDPNLATDLISGQLLNHLFEPLVRLDGEGVPQPALAESWEHSEDYKTWTFHLREGNTWHNGEPVTANDFVYGVKRLLNPATASTYAMMVYNIVENGQEYWDSAGQTDNVLGIEAVDDYTLRVQLNGPAPYFPSMLNHPVWYPLHAETVEAHGENWVNVGNYMSNGPYKLKAYYPKDRIILEKAENYDRADQVRLQELHWPMIDDGNTEMAAFLSGDLHVTDLMPHREAPRWKDKPSFHHSPMIGVYYIAMNNNVPPFDNPEVRKAFSKSINRQAIVDHIAVRGEVPAEGYIPHALIMPNGEDYRNLTDPLIDYENYQQQVEEAKQHLANAGYDTGGNQMPKVQYIYNVDDLHEDIAQNLQDTWKNVLGTDVDLQKLEWTTLLARGTAGDFQLMRSSWIGDYLDPMTFLEIFESGHGQNKPRYSNPRYDELLGLARGETDWQKRLEYLQEAERLLVVEDAAIAPVFEYTTPVLVRPELKGIVFTPLGGLDATRAYWETGEAG